MQVYSNFLLVILICVINCKGAIGDSTSNDPNPFQIVYIGVPKSTTDQCTKDDSWRVEHTRQLEATYQWGSDLIEECGYKVKAEAITVTRRIKKVFDNPEEKLRYFVKIYVDHKLLDIVEHSGDVRFDDNVITNGLFIRKVIKYSCEKMEFNYLMRGKYCLARTYEKQRLYREEKEDDKKVFVEDWRWRAFDLEECENSSAQSLEVEFANKLAKSPLVKKLE